MIGHTSTGAPTLRTPEQVWALRELLGADHLVHAVASSYRDWADFAAAPAAHVAHMLGNRFMQVPPVAPTIPFLPPAVRIVSRYDQEMPSTLRESENPPCLLFVTGTLPTTPALAVVGADNPTATGAEIARSAGVAAATENVPLVLPLRPGCSLWAARTALEAGATLIVVLGHGFGVTSSQQLLLEKVLQNGGAVLAHANPGAPGDEDRNDYAAVIAVTLASAVVLAEVGLHRAAAAPATRAAVAAGKFLIVPAPDAAPESGRYIAPTAMGSALFTSAREWSADAYGTNARIDQRTLNGLSPADAVIRDHLELTTAVQVGCAQHPRE